MAVLLWMPRRVKKKGSFGPKTSAWIRSLYPLVLGLGGWFLAVLIVMTIWPSVSFSNGLVAVLTMGIPIGLGIYWAWVHRDWTTQIKQAGLAAAMGAALIGAWIGFTSTAGLFALITTIVGAAIDHAPTFTNPTADISSRTTTSASVPWSPAAWDTVGEAGPVLEELLASFTRLAERERQMADLRREMFGEAR